MPRRSDREPRWSDRPRSRGQRSDCLTRRSDRPWNRGWPSDCHSKQSDRQTMRNSFITCFTDFGRATHDAHDISHTPRSAHTSTHATCGPSIHDYDDTIRVLALPAARLSSPSGCARATGTTAISIVAAGDGLTGQPLRHRPCRR
jgi:hypothetical protein